MKLQIILKNINFLIKNDINEIHEQNSKLNFQKQFRQKISVVIKISDAEIQKNEICFIKIDDFIDSNQISKYETSYVIVLFFLEL